MNARALAVSALIFAASAACSSEDRDASTRNDTGDTPMDASVADDAEPSPDAEPAPDADPADLGPIDIGPGSAPTIVAFAANPASVNAGQTSQLVWNVMGAANITITADPGGELVNTSTRATGSVRTPALDRTTSFTLVATNPWGMTNRMIFVGVDPGNPVIVSYTAAPNPVAVGESSTLSWVTQNAVRVRILSGPTVHLDTTDMVANGSWTTPALTEMSTSFTLEASNFAHMTTMLLIVDTQ